ncbi:MULTISPECIES: PotD/PotF family extracellular solute-binding protein [unclassified Micromonospora]|uniref:ABC transporter substrate-binding protein n=1 Tax=unclassified Micromonospora TaxID=2617518 RepID=UPI0010345652|nr:MULTISPECIES: extracellular solute-binding protein [unclassified Micromonospora]QKW12827.1 extracellular solute-binding protein [Verrucosispora sp. NA02020]TBL28291.1 extracellular solute-binding protein [Verrucosispora sp. SN26_14.1]
MRQGRISRRSFLAAAAAAATVPALGACGRELDPADQRSDGGGTPGKETVTIFAFLGNRLADMPKAFAEDYMSRHRNVEIKIYEDSNAVGYPKILAARQATPDSPLVNMGFFNSQISAQGDLDGVWNTLDYPSLSNAADVSDTFRRPNSNGIGIGADQIGIVYNTTAITTAPTSWADLWDDRHRGKVTLFDYWWQVVMMAARLNGGSVENMEPGWALWKEKARNIRTLVTANPEWQQVLSNGTADITSCWNGTGLQFKADGAPVDYVVPEEGAIAVPVYLQTVAGNSDNQQEICLDILNEMLSPRWCQMWAETAVQTPANGTVTLPAELAGLPGFQPANVEKLISVDWGLVAENMTAWRSRWDADIKANI